jgi:hypothetical protein
MTGMDQGIHENIGVHTVGDSRKNLQFFCDLAINYSLFWADYYTSMQVILALTYW